MSDPNLSKIIEFFKILLLFAVILYGIITPFICYLDSATESKLFHVRFEEFSGIVVKKYDVEVEHHAPYIDIELPDKSIKKIGLNNYYGDVFLNVQVGDTIFTKSSDTVVHIHRKDTSFTVIKLIPLH